MPPRLTRRPSEARRSLALLPPLTAGGFLLALAAVFLITALSYRALEQRNVSIARVTRTLSVLQQSATLLSGLKDAETGQRGYLLTGAEPYLGPYEAARAALPSQFRRLRDSIADNPQELDRLATIEQLADEKLAELAETIALRRAGDSAAALAIVQGNRGRFAMDQIRALVEQMSREEQARLVVAQNEWQDASVLSLRIQGVGSLVLVSLIVLAALLAVRDHRIRTTENWLRAGQAGLAAAVQGERRLEVLGDQLLRFLADTLDAPVGVLYVADRAGGYERVAGFAVPVGHARLQPGAGLLGQVAKDNAPRVVRDLPADYLSVGGELGQTHPRELLLAPAALEGEVLAVVELGFLRRVLARDLELMARVSEVLGIAVRSSRDRNHLESLLEETQRQSEELQAQQEELRVSNEELEEQSRALRESQTQLESQQSELEHYNVQLEEHTRLLENQRDALRSSESVLAAKGAELERANRYKSEFLANMSHELRTPLNSTLILANLLADNKPGNLSAEQVRFAQTIAAAGNDLLVLINDILDLSKIEAGKVELQITSVGIAATVQSLVDALLPIAADKGVTLQASVDPSAPARLDTDPQRLGQILKNLLSNALKFTQAGEVSVRVAGDAEQVRFAVHDTGIGIPAEQQALIFDAFRQADGSTHRQYGGTGLGLSISRDLAHLLGGGITVESTPGRGSVFTLFLPRDYGGAATSRRTPSASPGAAAALAPAP
ncbi:MAG: CHASE3 domain-containing protein, partial [Pseudomonadota bacterium]|nr:CHASE3 domain-containing protein [Pseudomonadota bacterium]